MIPSVASVAECEAPGRPGASALNARSLARRFGDLPSSGVRDLGRELTCGECAGPELLEERGLQGAAALASLVRVDHAGGEAEFIAGEPEGFAQVRVIGDEDRWVRIAAGGVEH